MCRKLLVIARLAVICLVTMVGASSFTLDVSAQEKIIVTDAPTTHHLNLYIALEKGIFKKYGLDVEYIKSNSMTEAADNVSKGKADILFACPTHTIITIAKEGKMRVIAQGKSPCTSILCVSPNSPIKKISDLKGKRVSGIAPTCEAVVAFIDAARAEKADFEVVKLPPDKAMPALEKGEIDASILEEPYASEMELKGYSLKFRELINVPCRFISANIEFLRKHPEAAKKFIAAIKEVNELYAKNPIDEEIVEIGHRYTGSSKEAIRHGNVRIHFTTSLNRPRIKAMMRSLVRLDAIKEVLKDEELYSDVSKGITW